jgi:hypothetical protein
MTASADEERLAPLSVLLAMSLFAGRGCVPPRDGR